MVPVVSGALNFTNDEQSGERSLSEVKNADAAGALTLAN
jgi:hypothetical protein